jgi:glycosyltransferase involved in cell wall biosynthesis
MKILYVYQTLARYGGVERVLADKMNYLASHYGYDIYILTRDQGSHKIPFPLDERVHYDDLGIRLHTQYAYKGLRRLWEKIKLQCQYEQRVSRKIKEIKPDIIIGTDVMPARSLLRHKGRAKLLIESHSMYRMTYAEPTHNPVKIFLKTMAFRAYRKADMLVSLTEGDANDWRSKNHNRKVCVIPNVVNLNTTGRLSNQSQKSAIFVGRFAKLKGIPYLMEIWKRVQARHPDWTLNIYGDGEEREKYDDLIASLNINVHQPTSQIHEAYCANSICLLTSVSESFSLVIPEAMSCGLPVVSFDCPYGPGDIITEGKDGFLIPQYDVEAFADKVCLLIENKDMRIQMGQAAYTSSQQYAAEFVMPKWKKLFETILE